jgi:hypothetical protein
MEGRGAEVNIDEKKSIEMAAQMYGGNTRRTKD